MSELLNSSLLLYFIIILIALNIFIFIWFLRLTNHYNSLIKTAKRKTLTSAIESIQKTLSSHEKKIDDSEKNIEELKDSSRSHIQDVRIKRYNPFSDTGGDHSFILSFLDEDKNGILLTSLHSRENTRFYVKSISGGKSTKHPLSDEEKSLITGKKRKKR